MDLLMAPRGSKHGTALFPPAPPVNISDAELLHDRMKSQLYSGCLRPLPVWISSEFLSAFRKLAPFWFFTVIVQNIPSVRSG